VNRLHQRKLVKVLKKIIREDNRTRYYLLNEKWLLIRKQKDRRRRKTLKRLWKLKRLALLRAGILPLSA
jgi:hypothetical protein